MTDAEIQGHEKRLLLTVDQIVMKKKRFAFFFSILYLELAYDIYSEMSA